MNNTVQMKPADNENRHDRKLFIGMISKTWSESDVRNLFARFGTIDDCTVLRLATGQSRGLFFPDRGKNADTPKDKDQKRQTQLVNNQANLLSTLSSSAINPVQPQYYSSILHHHLQQTQQQQQGFFSQLSPLGTVQGITGIGGLGSTGAIGLSALGSPHPSTTNADLATLLSSVNQTPHSLNFALAALGNSSLSPTGASGSSVGSGNSVANLTGNGLHSGLTSYHSGLRSAAVTAKQQHEGPDGCNLFIYHLPPELGDADLATMFASFGTVLSAKVFIDKQTNLSKCFGFVSFDNQLSAQMAIQAMHGFQLGMKRLKVQLKRAKSKDAAKPY
ncbi:CUGBP Elav-like family member 1-A [Orchesella cincta]|uniref:CUGBP Elav-like family member 1-A n=1 Tax=Orchesella cincta TaxID=48709 RepID=A0A1D2MBA3_ORCCI|nr:CUGBP Elav-like family member 1-A [Orchesella cincta]